MRHVLKLRDFLWTFLPAFAALLGRAHAEPIAGAECHPGTAAFVCGTTQSDSELHGKEPREEAIVPEPPQGGTPVVGRSKSDFMPPNFLRGPRGSF